MRKCGINNRCFPNDSSITPPIRWVKWSRVKLIHDPITLSTHVACSSFKTLWIILVVRFKYSPPLLASAIETKFVFMECNMFTVLFILRFQASSRVLQDKNGFYMNATTAYNTNFVQSEIVSEPLSAPHFVLCFIRTSFLTLVRSISVSPMASKLKVLPVHTNPYHNR